MDGKELRDEAYSRLAIWRDGCAEIHERARESRKILLLQDPKQDEGNKGKRTLQLQTLKSTFNNCVADQVDNMPEALMVPETQELSEVADDLTDVVRFVMELNDYESLHRVRVEDCFCTGTSVMQVVWDDSMDGGKGNVALIRWPVEAFLWDPASETIEDARALFKVSWHPMSWFHEHYPENAAEIGSDEGEFSGLGMHDAQSEAEAQDEDKAMLVEYWYRRYDAKKKKYSINVAYLAGGTLLESYENVYAHGMYPFVVDTFSRIEGLPVGEGMIQELAPMMRYVNRYQSYIDMNLRMSSKGRLLVDKAAGIDTETLTDWESDVIEGDRIDSSAIQWLQTQPFGVMANNQVLQLQTDIKQDSGQSQFTRGETAGGVTAAGAISALQEAGGKITRLHTLSLNRGFREMALQVMWLISEFYDRRRVMFITGKRGGEMKNVDASPERLFGRKGNGALPPPPYTVQVQVQRRNPLRQQAQNELFMQAYSMSAQSGQLFPLTALFEILQVDGKDRILPVLREVENYSQALQEAQQAAQSAMQENEKLKQTVSGLQQLNAKYAKQMRGAGKMYTAGKQTDEVFPKTGANGVTTQ